MSNTSTTDTGLELPAPGVYDVDPVHSSVSFVVRHLVAAKVRGNFTEFSGEFTVGDPIETSSVSATVQAASITSANEMRDGHLKSPDFLDLANHPTLELRSTRITPKRGGHYELEADLTIRGVTRPVVFDLEYLGTGPSMTGGTMVGFEARAEIDRRDFNVSFEGTLENGSVVVGHKVTIELTIEGHKRA